ncbi:hypothetical protein V1503_24735 [Bacillus sp. SCS-151]|uniref:hypothetical protein n=1 Tax=Nanhaiella sioensis TaxID=3115293 RepID=UPI00397A40EF
MARINIATDCENKDELETIKKELKKRLSHKKVNCLSIVEEGKEKAVNKGCFFVYSAQ